MKKEIFHKLDDRQRVLQVRDLILEIFRVNGNLIETGNHLTQPLGITSALWQVMGALGFSSGPLSVPDIAKRMGLTRQSVQRNIDLLVERGLVILKPNPRHLRSSLAALTDAGQAALDQVDASHQWLSKHIADEIGDARIQESLRVLQEMNNILEARSTGINEEENVK